MKKLIVLMLVLAVFLFSCASEPEEVVNELGEGTVLVGFEEGDTAYTITGVEADFEYSRSGTTEGSSNLLIEPLGNEGFTKYGVLITPTAGSWDLGEKPTITADLKATMLSANYLSLRLMLTDADGTSLVFPAGAITGGGEAVSMTIPYKNLGARAIGDLVGYTFWTDGWVLDFSTDPVSVVEEGSIGETKGLDLSNIVSILVHVEDNNDAMGYDQGVDPFLVDNIVLYNDVD